MTQFLSNYSQTVLFAIIIFQSTIFTNLYLQALVFLFYQTNIDIYPSLQFLQISSHPCMQMAGQTANSVPLLVIEFNFISEANILKHHMRMR